MLAHHRLASAALARFQVRLRCYHSPAPAFRCWSPRFADCRQQKRPQSRVLLLLAAWLTRVSTHSRPKSAATWEGPSPTVPLAQSRIASADAPRSAPSPEQGNLPLPPALLSAGRFPRCPRAACIATAPRDVQWLAFHARDFPQSARAVC